MGQISKELYEFMLQNKCNMTDEWLSTRVKADGSTYSQNATAQIEEQLREQNAKFIEAVSLVFIQEREEYRTYMEDWVAIVAQERVRQAVPLHEVIAQLRIFRGIYWGYVRKFFDENSKATSKDALRWSEAINHAFDYIIESFAIHHYEATQKILMSQQAMINELSSPVIPIKKGVGILPLVGDIDTHRAKVILETALEQSVKWQLDTLYIDLSAVAIIDTMVAQQLFQLMASLKIVGVQSVLSGIRPEIAQTAITLGIDFKDIKVHANLMRALESQ
ncbi:STAS domain-containing protein [Planococcus sp. N028]|uniref:STAS domain-containing protein n=1 Tax=Planococcus shixiaomingii TaxID=3058393 RepID=A0ABT8N5R4_9BACL|nr:MULTISPECIES: STAS domain-containing protein [unclassified Planococcus (in: firmicutes)]MDN7243219.1 STAS domain-containing protein [Planococcus sp. N028]WKA55162.1 STAS domain-containing protein [Planococcus sp. N022]